MDFSEQEIMDISSRVDFSSLRRKSILMTGATGFVGHWMRKGLQAARKQQNVAFGLFQMNSTTPIYNTPHFDYVIHLAPIPISQILAHVRSPEVIFFSSSGAVYRKELNEYGRDKLRDENILLNLKAETRIARLFTFCGPYLRPKNFAVGNFVKNAVANEPIIIKGNGQAIRTYMYGADLSVWLWNIILQGKDKEIYNVGSEEPYSIETVADIVRHVINPDLSINILNEETSENSRYIPSTYETRKNLRVDETFDLEYQIMRYAEWMREEDEDEDLI